MSKERFSPNIGIKGLLHDVLSSIEDNLQGPAKKDATHCISFLEDDVLSFIRTLQKKIDNEYSGLE